MNFWLRLPKPFFVLAPMSDVTDSAFRQVYAKHGKPDVFVTEFVSCAGLCSPGKERVLKDLFFAPAERPIVAQLWGNRPEQFYASAKIIRSLGFDGLDINMGCPDKSVERQGGGAALMKNPRLASRIIAETKRGAGPLPVSIKTRIGYDRDELNTWLPVLLKMGPAAITVHARTRKQMSRVPADWSIVARAVALTKKLGSQTLIIGNGDVASLAEGRRRVQETGCDGIMVGRGVFGNPWFFDANKRREPTVKQKLSVLVEHAKLFEQIHQDRKSYNLMKKHIKAYVAGFPEAKKLRLALMGTTTTKELIIAIKQFQKNKT